MRFIISVVLAFSCFVSCSSRIPDDRNSTSEVDVVFLTKSRKTVELTSTVLRQGSDNIGDLGILHSQVNKLGGYSMSIFEFIDYIKVAKMYEAESGEAHRVASTILENYVDGEYAWVGGVLSSS